MMKKIFLLLLAGAMLLTACTSGEDGTGGSNDGGTEQTDPGSNTLGDDDGDGIIEDGDDGGDSMGDMMDGADGGVGEPGDDSGTGNSNGTGGSDNGGTGNGDTGSGNGSTNNNGNGTTGNSDSGSIGNGGTSGDNGSGNASGGNDGGSASGSNGGGSASGSNGGGTASGGNGGSLNAGSTNFTEVDSVESAADAVNFIGANVYSRCPTVIPLMTETRVLSTEDRDSISYNTGLTDTSGIDDVIVSESASNAVAYSFVMLRTDGTNTSELQKALGEGVNPGKWSGMQAEKAASVMLDDDVILVMGSAEQVDTILNAVMAAAKDVYENVGSVVPVLG